VSGERRKLTAVDDPLAFGEPTPPAPARPSPTRSLPALFVRLPVPQSEALARAAFELKVHKRELVAALISRYVDPTPDGLARLHELLENERKPAG
jgi:hypothetical protein